MINVHKFGEVTHEDLTSPCSCRRAGCSSCCCWRRQHGVEVQQEPIVKSTEHRGRERVCAWRESLSTYSITERTLTCWQRWGQGPVRLEWWQVEEVLQAVRGGLVARRLCQEEGVWLGLLNEQQQQQNCCLLSRPEEEDDTKTWSNRKETKD